MEKENNLTHKQQEIYDLLVYINNVKWNIPTLSEISKITGKRKSTIWELLRKIEKKGYIKIERYKERGITLLMEEEENDEFIYFSENDIKEAKNVICRPSKRNKQSRGSLWS